MGLIQRIKSVRVGFGSQPVFLRRSVEAHRSIVPCRLVIGAVGLVPVTLHIQETCLAEVTLKLEMRFLCWVCFVQSEVERSCVTTDRIPADRAACSSVQEQVVEVINESPCGDIFLRKLSEPAE